jgi:SAM-dependent methyltransferase
MGVMREWFPDEQTYAGGEHLDAEYVAAYDRKAGYDPSDDISILRDIGLTSDSTVVDLGAGTGVFTIAAAELCGRVIAVDVSAAMTARLRERVAELSLDNVTVVDAGFLSYEHDGELADAVFTRNALHHLPDLWKAIALERIASVLRPGGVLRLRDLIFDFDPVNAEARIGSWLAEAVTDASIGYTAEELAEHVRSEFSTYSWLFDIMLDKAGFQVLDRSFVRSAYGAYTCERRISEVTFPVYPGQT